MMSRATSCPTAQVARVVQAAALVQQLRAWGEPEAKIWFERYWCGERGTWTVGDAEVGGVAHNNGVEGRWPSFTQAVCGAAGKSCKLKIDVFVALLLPLLHTLTSHVP